MNKEAKLPAAVKAAPKKKRKSASLDRKKGRAGWFFIMPFLLGFILIYLPIIFDSIRYSFMELQFTAGGGYTLTPVGFENYQNALFTDSNFVKTLTSGVKQMVFDIPAIVIFSLFMAVLLNQKMIGRAAFRAIFFVPVILCTGLIDSLDQSNVMLEYMSDMEESIDTGTGAQSTSEQLANAADLTWLFGSMQVGSQLVTYVQGLVADIYDIINRSGVQMLIYLAGLQSISAAIYESCQIDGASAWETFWKITFPMISPMILVNSIYTVIDSFTIASNPVMTYIQKVYDGVNGQTLSSAMSWLYFLIVLLMIGLVTLLLSAYIFYQRRD